MWSFFYRTIKELTLERDLCRLVIWYNSSAQRWSLGAGCPGPCPDSFWISAKMETPQPVLATCASAQSTLTMKKCFQLFRQSLIHFLPPVLSVCTTEKSLSLSSLHPPFRHFSRLKSPSSQPFLIREMFQFHCYLGGLFLGLSPVCPCLTCTGEPRTGHNTPAVSSAVLSGRKRISTQHFWQV